MAHPREDPMRVITSRDMASACHQITAASEALHKHFPNCPMCLTGESCTELDRLLADEAEAHQALVQATKAYGATLVGELSIN
jgi:hypothetical protein